MKKRELYDQRIVINEQFSIQIDVKNQEMVNLYLDNHLLEQFKLNRKI